jgi:hypothetical protein
MARDAAVTLSASGLVWTSDPLLNLKRDTPNTYIIKPYYAEASAKPLKQRRFPSVPVLRPSLTALSMFTIPPALIDPPYVLDQVIQAFSGRLVRVILL